MHLQKFLALGLAALLIVGGTAYAGLTGVIAGKITDADGNPIPGVTVTVTSPSLQGARVDTTSANGMYRMPELPPGIYTIKAELMGMKTIERKNVRVSVNSTAKIDLKMEMSPIKETVVVVGKSQVLDVKSATVKTSIEREVTERLPGSDDLFSAFSMSGGITGGGNVRVHGGANTDNLYLFDGVDTTDPVTSTFGANLNADAIEEVEVQTGGFSAEYGRSMGGIVNAVTKSGGNEFHGILRLKYVDSGWHSDFVHPRAEADYNYWTPTITFDGPILKDKLWFMVTYNYLKRDDSVKVLRRYDSPNGDNGDYVSVDASREFNLPYGKLTYQPNQSHKLVFNYSGEDATIYGYAESPEYQTWETVTKQEQGGPFFSLEWTWLYNSNLFFITRAGAMLGKLEHTPQFDSSKPNFFDNDSRRSYHGASTYTKEDRDRYQLAFNANYFLEDLMGSHEFKSGLEYQHVEWNQKAGYPGGAKYLVDLDDKDPNSWTKAERTVIFGYDPDDPWKEADTSSDYYAFYIQDDWSILDNVTLNLGVRYEYTEYENQDGESSVPGWSWGQWRASDYIAGRTYNSKYGYEETVYRNYADLKFDDMLAPRIGVNWDIFGDGKEVLHAYWGRFYNPFDLSIADMFQPFHANTFANERQKWVGPAWADTDGDGVPDTFDTNGDGVPDKSYNDDSSNPFYDDNNWETFERSQPTVDNLLDPDLDAEYTDEFNIGFEHEIIDNFSIGITYTHRRSGNMIEDVGLFVDEDQNVVWTYQGGVKDDFSGIDPNKKYDPREGIDYANHVYYVTNVPGDHRQYNGVEINARARLEHFDLQASYTYSKAKGTVIEGQEGYSGIAQFSGQYDTWATSQNLYGELPWSCRHYLKMSGSWHQEFTDWYELSIGISMFERSGYHYSKRMTPPKTYDPDKPDNDINDPSTWTGKPPYKSYAWYFPEGRGKHVLPEFTNWDVSIQNTFKFGKWGSLTCVFDVDNLFDNQGVLARDDVENRKHPEWFGRDVAWASPREWRIQFKYAF